MDSKIDRSPARAWALARSQHGAIARRQLLALGFHSKAIEHRLRVGRLHPTRWRGVYAVGRRELDRLGTWVAALLAAGEGAVLSHLSAAALERTINEADKRDLVDPETLRGRSPSTPASRASPSCATCSTGARSRSPTPSSSAGSCRSRAMRGCRRRERRRESTGSGHVVATLRRVARRLGANRGALRAPARRRPAA